MNAYHVIAYQHFGDDDGKGDVSRSTTQAHFLVLCKSEGDCVALIKEATGERDFDKYTIERSEEILNRPVESHTPSEQVYSL